MINFTHLSSSYSNIYTRWNSSGVGVLILLIGILLGNLALFIAGLCGFWNRDSLLSSSTFPGQGTTGNPHAWLQFFCSRSGTIIETGSGRIEPVS